MYKGKYLLTTSSFNGREHGEGWAVVPTAYSSLLGPQIQWSGLQSSLCHCLLAAPEQVVLLAESVFPSADCG